MAENKNTSLTAEPKYIITPAMNKLIEALKDCGYEVEVNSYAPPCYDDIGGFYFKRYCTEITIDEYTGDGDNYEFVFTPDGKRISDYHFNEEYCVRTSIIKKKGE